MDHSTSVVNHQRRDALIFLEILVALPPDRAVDLLVRFADCTHAAKVLQNPEGGFLTREEQVELQNLPKHLEST